MAVSRTDPFKGKRGTGPCRYSLLKVKAQSHPVRIAQVAERHISVIQSEALELEADTGAQADQAAQLVCAAPELVTRPESEAFVKQVLGAQGQVETLVLSEPVHFRAGSELPFQETPGGAGLEGQRKAVGAYLGAQVLHHESRGPGFVELVGGPKVQRYGLVVRRVQLLRDVLQVRAQGQAGSYFRLGIGQREGHIVIAEL